MRKRFLWLLPVLTGLVIIVVSCSRKVVPATSSGLPETFAAGSLNTALWQEIKSSNIQVKGKQNPLPKQYRVFQLNTKQMRELLSKTLNDTLTGKKRTELIALPMPEGNLNSFSISESQTMNPALLAKFPHLRTYGGKGKDDPTATVKLDFMHTGFHAYIFTQNGSVIIHPFSEDDTTNYMCYYKHYTSEIKQAFEIPADSIK
ncbi:MAG: hypothetical protein AB9842_04975 [Bacteroidales bacterium]